MVYDEVNPSIFKEHKESIKEYNTIKQLLKGFCDVKEQVDLILLYKILLEIKLRADLKESKYETQKIKTEVTDSNLSK